MRLALLYLPRVGLLVALALALTGCMHVDRDITLNGDGSGEYTLIIGFSSQLLSQQGDQINPAMDSFGAMVKQQGGTFRYYDDAGYTYWAFTRPFETVGELNALIQDDPRASSVAGLVNAAQNNLRFTERPGLLSNTFHITGIIHLEFPPNPTTPQSNPPDPAYFKDMREVVSITMPGAITAHTGGALNGNTITYTVRYGETATIDVTGDGGSTIAALALAGAGGVFILGMLVAGGVIWKRRRNSRNRSARAGALIPYPPDAPTLGGSA